MAVPDFYSTLERKHIALCACDSMHDFLKPGKQARCTPQPTNKFREVLAQKLGSTPELRNMYDYLIRDDVISNSEAAAEKLIGPLVPEPVEVFFNSKDVKRLRPIDILQLIFVKYFGFPSIVDFNNPIKLVMDGGKGRLGTLASQVLFDEAKKSNDPIKLAIIHVVTPATACDSAGMSIQDFAGNPVLFDSPFPVGIDLAINPDERSDAAFFSGSFIAPRSNPFDSSSKSPCRIIIDGQFIDLPIGTFGPPVYDLCSAIHEPKTKTKYFLDRFSPAQKFDIKRCGDSDQIRFCKKLIERDLSAGVHRDGGANGYVFVTIDKICALISAHYYGLPTIFHSSKGFILYNVRQQAVGGKPNLPIPNPPPKKMQQYGGEADDLPDEALMISNLCALAKVAVVNGLNLTPDFKPLAAACSIFNISTMPDGQLRNEYIRNHNIIYPEAQLVLAAPPSIDDITRVINNGIDKNFIVENLHPDAFKLNFYDELPSVLADFMPNIGNHEVIIPQEDLINEALFPEIGKSHFELLKVFMRFIVDPSKNKNVVLLTLALIDAYITNPKLPGCSVIYSIFFSDIRIPASKNIPFLENRFGYNHVDGSTLHAYSQLIIILSTMIGNRGITRHISIEAFNLVGGNSKKTYRKKNRKNRNKTKKMKRG